MSSSLGRPPIRDDFNCEIIGELGSKTPIQPQVSALHDEKAHPAPLAFIPESTMSLDEGKLNGRLNSVKGLLPVRHRRYSQ
jgi:hypothetical protein